MPHKKKLTPSSLSLSIYSLVERKILLIRRQKVMVDSDLAELYGVPTRQLNQQVARNKRRFPKDFMFRLTKKESQALRSQIVISNPGRGGRRYLPYAFTEQGVAMLSSVLNRAKHSKWALPPYVRMWLCPSGTSQLNAGCALGSG